jgi:hypothetical protein
MRITLWGTRGSLAVPEAKTARYGGDTSCVEVRGSNGTVLVLDSAQAPICHKNQRFWCINFLPSDPVR